jgi:NAD-dependent SIR2 family protein deacetylase
VLDTAIATLGLGPIAVITGAGISTDSGIPDYRGAGAPPRNPMQLDRFLASEHARRRYWAGSHLGWRTFSSTQPNAGHRAIARMEAAGLLTGVATQNVDDLHEKAGSRNVTHLHGANATVTCLDCGSRFPRQVVADRIAEQNPWIAVPESVRMNPDGDVDLEGDQDFTVPACFVCGGMLKPDVVFFGEFVPSHVFHEADMVVRAASVVLVAGSSLAVNTAIRLLEVARRRELPVVVVNRGPTKWDRRATVRIDAGTSETLTAFADALVPGPQAS